MGAIESRSNASHQQLFDKLLSYSGLVYHICLGFSANPSDAEELYQEVYLRAWSDLGSLRTHDSGRQWLLRIARNIGLNHVRKVRSDRRMVVGHTSSILIDKETPEAAVLRQERRIVLKQAVGRLPKKYREVFVLREYGELSYEDIAATLEISMGTVMSRLNRARRAILRSFEEKGYGKDDESKN